MFGKKCAWHKWRSLSVVLGLLSLCIMTLIAVYATGWKEENLKWQDNFDSLMEDKWQHVITGNRGNDGGFQYFRRDKRNSYVKDGSLHLRATLVSDELSDEDIRSGFQGFRGCDVEPCIIKGEPEKDCILPVYSAQLQTKDTFTVKHGRIEVRAKFPSGDWLKPEISLLPVENAYGTWPASGEICIAEGSGNKYMTAADGHPIGANTVRQSLRWAPSVNASHFKQFRWETTLHKGYFSDDFHAFELEWTSAHIAFRVDGRETGRVVPPEGGFWELGAFSTSISEMLNPWLDGTVMAPFDREFYLVVKLSVGGSYFEDAIGGLNYPKPWNWNSSHPITDFYENSIYYAPTWERPELEIDYIRVYEH